MRGPALAMLLMAQACQLHAQAPSDGSEWSPGGGIGLALQGETGIEVHGNYLYVRGAPDSGRMLYQVGPELSLGAYIDSPFFWGQRLGIRQMLTPTAYVSLVLTGGLENYTTGLSLEDTRAFVQGGVNLLGLFSVEVAAGRPLTNASPIPSLDRVILRLDINGPMLNHLLSGVPIS